LKTVFLTQKPKTFSNSLQKNPNQSFMSSSTPITPCLWCKDNALVKAEYYCKIFPNSKILGQHPAMVIFELNGTKFMALNGGVDFAYNESVSFVVDCVDQTEVDHYWDTFLADGGIAMDCAWIQDKFGMRWQIVPKQLGILMMDPDPNKAGRVMQAMLKMQKIIVADLEAAYNQES
jgi:predicted 3-demethylubiquinone-9 3-methyltransferase (glyoxalase superfamily)